MRTRLALSIVAVLLPRLAAAEDDSPGLSIYGFARLDILADDARMSNATSADFVLLDDKTPGKGDFAMTPRLSRVGLTLDQWRVTDNVVTGDGKLEVDFAGGDDAANAIRLRHAYGALQLKHKVQLLVGQTWDLASPLFPSAQNDTELRFAGNIGDRRPQVRLEALGEHLHAGVALAASGARAAMDLDGDGMRDGVASAAPMLQWLVEYRRRASGNLARIGISGHTTKHDAARDRGRSVGMHAFLPLSRQVVVLGEGYLGENVADLGGSVGELPAMPSQKAIRSAGGWLEMAAVVTRKHSLGVGTSIDTSVARTVEDGQRTRNRTVYGVLRYAPRPALQLGAELLGWETTYKALGSASATRLDLHASVLF